MDAATKGLQSKHLRIGQGLGLITAPIPLQPLADFNQPPIAIGDGGGSLAA